MSEGQGEKIWESEKLKTGADKARAAQKLGWRAVRRGVSKEDAGDRAIHELKHALPDKGDTSTMSLHKKGDNLGFRYNPNRKLSSQDEERILQGPGKDMSDSDRERLGKIRSKKKSLLRRLLGW